MAAAESPLRELAEAAAAARKFRLTTRFEVAPNKALIVQLSAEQVSGRPLYWAHLNIVTHPQGRTTGVTQLLRANGAGDLVRQVVAAYPGAQVVRDSVEVAIEKGPTTASKLRPVAVQAWHEALGLPVPSMDELEAEQKAKRAARESAAKDAVTLLKSGLEAVEAFNRRPLAERRDMDLRKADLAGCRLDGVAFAGANLDGADLSGASLVGADFWGSPSPSRLKGAKLVGADLSGAKVMACRGNDADFSRAVLKGAELGYGHFQRARFVDADLTDARLTGSDLRGADFTGANLQGVIFDPVSPGKFDEQTRWPKGYRPPAGLRWKGDGPDPRQAPTRKERAAPRPTDVAGFLGRLKTVADSAKLDKAMAMLKADRFRLFARVREDGLVGVVKSQSDPDLVYSCRLAGDGTYACCTQNLNICGGLRGSPCKHLLVLIVGLTQAGELDPGTAHDWIQASRGQKPNLDKDAMTETFLQYKGAEAGEVDWRPTETIPEDFYAL